MTRALHLLTLIAVLMAAVTVPAVASAPPVRGIDAAAWLRLSVSTTSDWTAVQLHGAEIVKHQIDDRVSGQTWGTDRFGLKRDAGAVRASVDIDLLVQDPADREDFSLTVEKGNIGQTEVAVIDVASDRTLLRVQHDQNVTGDPTNLRRWALERSKVMDAPLRMPHADSRQLLLAFYYPWFERYDDVRVADEPAEPRSTFSSTGVRSMTRQAKLAGVDGFVVSWGGEQRNGEGFDLALAAAEREGQLITGYLETAAARSADTARDWLRQLLERSTSPAFLRHGGRPVVFVYRMDVLTPDDWRRIIDEVGADGPRPLLVGDTPKPAYEDVSWGEHRYSATGTAADRAAEARRRALTLRAGNMLRGNPAEPWIASVAPGYDDRRVRSGSPLVPREDGQRYASTWDAALSSDPDWLVITSWNEWYEGTSIEPSVLFGDHALRQTAQLSTAWRKASSPGLPPGVDLGSVIEVAVSDAVALSQRVFPAGGSATAVVVVGDHDFADALAAQPLVGGDGPTMFVPGGPDGTLPSAVASEIRRVLSPRGRIVIVGGNQAVSDEIARQLGDLAPTRRLAGTDRILTAIEVARELVGTSRPSEVVLARADDWADAVTGGAYAASTRVPVLLSWTGELPGPVADQLRRWSPRQVTLLGGTAALSERVAGAVPAPTRRVAGADRAETAAEIAGRLWPSSDGFVLVDGYSPEGWQGALAAGPLSARVDAPQLLVSKSQVPAATQRHLSSDTRSVLVVGALAKETVALVDRLLRP